MHQNAQTRSRRNLTAQEVASYAPFPTKARAELIRAASEYLRGDQSRQTEYQIDLEDGRTIVMLRHGQVSQFFMLEDLATPIHLVPGGSA